MIKNELIRRGYALYKKVGKKYLYAKYITSDNQVEWVDIKEQMDLFISEPYAHEVAKHILSKSDLKVYGVCLINVECNIEFLK